MQGDVTTWESAVEGLSVLGTVGLGVVALMFRVGPLRLVSRGLDYVRAGAYMVGEMWQGAMARRTRWSECVERARWER